MADGLTCDGCKAKGRVLVAVRKDASATDAHETYLCPECLKKEGPSTVVGKKDPWTPSRG